jgi:hypothetical protein
VEEDADGRRRRLQARPPAGSDVWDDSTS